MYRVDMVPKVVQVLELFLPTLRVVAAYRLATLLSELPFFQMMVIKMVISDHGATILECPLPGGKPLIANAARALSRVH